MAGAHLAGLPLHHELLARGATAGRRTTTSADYRLFALPGGPPCRPALVRVSSGGCAIEVEVYRLPRSEIGELLVRVPPPLALGSVRLASSQLVCGFVCEPIALEGAADITSYGGWRAYLASGALARS